MPKGCASPAAHLFHRSLRFRHVNVLILTNARSGRGRARRGAHRVAQVLHGHGHRVRAAAVAPGAMDANVPALFDEADVVVAAGGDGTVLLTAELVLAREREGPAPALYHLPYGNENLFAREFGMSRSGEDLVRALRSPRVVRVDLGWLEGDDSVTGGRWARPFLLMAGFGLDAGVIERLDAARNRPLGHLAYLSPIIAEFLRPHFPRFRVTVDGEPVVQDQSGMLLVGNCRKYACRLNPARRASMTDGLLDVVFLPCAGIARGVAWAGRCWAGTQEFASGAVYRQGRRVEIVPSEGCPAQVDGECVRRQLDGPLEAWVQRGAIPVITRGDRP